MTGASDGLAQYMATNAVRLATVDPAVPLDDLEPLCDLVGDARVVAIGEHTHHVHEYFQLRHRIARFLVERCGFTHVAVEAPFSEGVAVARWLDGGPGELREVAEAGMHFDMGSCQEVQDMLAWLRGHNEGAAEPVGYLGVDLPATLASMLPALEAVAEFLRSIDPDTLAMVEQARRLGAAYAGENLFVSVPRYGALESSLRHELTALLSHLQCRFEYLAPHYTKLAGRDSYDTALRHLRSAWCLDLYHREMDAVWNGSGSFAEGSARDAFMGESILWLLDRAGPDAKVVLAAHNSHIQRVPWSARNAEVQGSPLPEEDGESRPPAADEAVDHFMMGYYLAEALGPAYVSIAVTSGGGSTVEWNLDEGQPKGIRVEEVPVADPAPGSVEAALAASGAGLCAVDLRSARGRAGLQVHRMNMQDQVFEIPVLLAFDAVIHVPRTTVTDFVRASAAQAS